MLTPGPGTISETWIVRLIEPTMFQPAPTANESAAISAPMIDTVSAAANFSQYPAPLRSDSAAAYPLSYAKAFDTDVGKSSDVLWSATATGTETSVQSGPTATGDEMSSGANTAVTLFAASITTPIGFAVPVVSPLHAEKW